MSLAAVAGCMHGPSCELTPAGRRAVLLDPSAPFWNAIAPEAYDVRVETTKGPFVVRIIHPWAPRGADRFAQLVRASYYDDSRISRVVPKFIAQFGIAGDAAVNAVWAHRTFLDDSVRHSNMRGTIAFATTGPNGRTTQLYINLVDNIRLDRQGFAPIGRVVEGIDVVDKLYSGYGENSGGGVRTGKQGPLLAGGNAYADREYPMLDHITAVRVCPCSR